MMRGAPLYNPRVCVVAVWFGSGADLPVGKTALPTGIPGESRGGQPDPLWRGSNVAPLLGFFCKAFFHLEKKRNAGDGVNEAQFGGV